MSIANVSQFQVTLVPTPLPSRLVFANPDLLPNDQHEKAYALARRLEGLHSWPRTVPTEVLPTGWPRGKLTPQVAGRLLGYLLIEAPLLEGADAVAREIIGKTQLDVFESTDSLRNTDVEALASLAQYYSLTLLKTFTKYSGKTPLLSSHPSRPSFEDDRKIIEDEMEPGNGSYSRSKTDALRRDNHRCVLTGSMDSSWFHNLPWSVKEHMFPDIGSTNAAHIIPHKLSQNLDNPEKSHHVSAIWTILERWAGFDVDEVNGEQINSLENIFTLSANMHDFYDQLWIWFTHIEGNTYKVESVYASCLKALTQNPITFTSTDPALPLPRPEYLKLHRLCARVVHLSGAAEYIDDVIRREKALLVPSGARVLTEESSGDLSDLLISLRAPTSVC